MQFYGFSDINSEIKRQNTYKFNPKTNFFYNSNNNNNYEYNNKKNNTIISQRQNNNYITHPVSKVNSFKEYEKIITSRIGLFNLGNTCYMNTCLQNLIHCKFFIKKLVKINERQTIKNNTPITFEFLDLC